MRTARSRWSWSNRETTLNEVLERHDLLPDPTHKSDGATSYVQFETWEQVGLRTPSISI
jgi:hypothetical protein